MRVFLAILIYIALVAAMVALKPAFLFSGEGEEAALKVPGLAQTETHSMMAAAVFFPLLAAVVYYIVATISVIRVLSLIHI